MSCVFFILSNNIFLYEVFTKRYIIFFFIKREIFIHHHNSKRRSKIGVVLFYLYIYIYDPKCTCTNKIYNLVASSAVFDTSSAVFNVFFFADEYKSLMEYLAKREKRNDALLK